MYKTHQWRRRLCENADIPSIVIKMETIAPHQKPKLFYQSPSSSPKSDSEDHEPKYLRELWKYKNISNLLLATDPCLLGNWKWKREWARLRAHRRMVRGSMRNWFQDVCDRMNRLINHYVSERATMFVVITLSFIDSLSTGTSGDWLPAIGFCCWCCSSSTFINH